MNSGTFIKEGVPASLFATCIPHIGKQKAYCVRRISGISILKITLPLNIELSFVWGKMFQGKLRVLWNYSGGQTLFSSIHSNEGLWIIHYWKVSSLSYVCLSVGWTVCYNFLKGRKVTLPCSYGRPCLILYWGKKKLTRKGFKCESFGVEHWEKARIQDFT